MWRQKWVSEGKDSDPPHESCNAHLHPLLPEARSCLICKVVYLFKYRLMPAGIQRRRLWEINTFQKTVCIVFVDSVVVLEDETQTESFCVNMWTINSFEGSCLTHCKAVQPCLIEVEEGLGTDVMGHFLIKGHVGLCGIRNMLIDWLLSLVPVVTVATPVKLSIVAQW